MLNLRAFVTLCEKKGLGCNGASWYYDITMKTITFKVTDDEERYLRGEARKAGTTVSGFLRRKLRGESAVEVVTSRATGAPVFRLSGSGEGLTTEAVREMLADFP